MRSALSGIGLFVFAISLAGCDASFDITKVLPGTGIAGSERLAEAEPNNTFEQATLATVDYSTMLDLNGSMASSTDIDIYDLGPVTAGDHVTVVVDNGSSMDLAAALFDEQQRLIAVNDDRIWRSDPRPEIGVSVRRECTHVYLVISASPSASSSSGSYTATVLREQGAVPATRQQVLYLGFNGAKGFAIPGQGATDIPAFNAANIDASFAGQTPAMIDAIVAAVHTHYAAFNVQIVASTESAKIPSDATVVYFGLYNAQLLGISDNCDDYNADLTQNAVVFTDTFSMFMPLQPTLQQVAVAIGNVASHEAGHLLGLEHTQQWTDLMDTTSPAQSLLTMQSFEVAPLYNRVFPIGEQDSGLLLAETVGNRPITAASHIDRHDSFANTVRIAESGSRVITEGAPSGFQHASRAAEVSPDIWRLLLYGQGSVQNEVSKDCFAVHSRRSAAR